MEQGLTKAGIYRLILLTALHYYRMRPSGRMAPAQRARGAFPAFPPRFGFSFVRFTRPFPFDKGQ
jgi:hypothetical protein